MKLFDTIARLLFRSYDVSREKTPIYLISITGEGTTNRFAVFRESIEYPVSSGITYTAGGASISPFNYSSDLSPDSITITLLASDSKFSGYLLMNRIPKLTVTVQKVFYEDLTVAAYTVFSGFLRGIVSDAKAFTLDFVPWMYLLENNMLRIATRVSCNHRLYSPACGVSETGNYGGYGFQHTASVASLNASGNTVVVDSMASLVSPYPVYANGFFTDGSLRFTSGGYTYKSHILDHTGTTLILMSNLPVLEVGNTVVIQAGCDFSHSTCTSRFNNLSRFLGMPLIPKRNPTTDGADDFS